MQKSKKNIIEITTIIFLLILALISCEKDNKKNQSVDEVTKSERQKYEFSVPNAGFSLGCPTLVNNYIYIGTSAPQTYSPSPNNYFYKLDKTLAKIWEYPLGSNQVRGAASLDSYGNIYFAVDSNNAMSSSVSIMIYSLDNNGNFRWSKNIGGDQTVGITSLAIADDNTIYAGGDMFYAMDINGNVKWTYSNYIPGFMRSAPIIDPNGNLFFSAFEKIYSLDKNGNQRWIYTAAYPTDLTHGVSSPAFTKDYTHLIVAIDKNIYSLHTSDGSLSWLYEFNINADFRSSPAVDDNGNIYIGSHGNGGEKDESTLYAIKADGSGIIWQFNLGSDIYSSPTLGNDRVIYIGSEGFGNTENKWNHVHAFNMSDGQRIWSAQTPMDVTWGSPILSENGILYVSSMHINGGRPSGIYGFLTDATGLLPNCGSPTFQLSNAHNGKR